jgi:ribonuclease E
MSVQNQKRKDLAELESQHDTQIVIIADHETGYGEMAAEIERREDEAAEKPAPRHPERFREPEEETVVLGGDAPISFEKALGLEQKPPQSVSEVEIKYDRRDAQRAALGERERLRALFESARPEDELMPEGLQSSEENEEVERKVSERSSRRRRPRGKGDVLKIEASTATPSSVKVQADASRLALDAEPLPEPPILTGDLLAGLVTPIPRPKLLGSVAPAVDAADKKPSATAPEGRKRGRSKVEKPEPSAESLPEEQKSVAKRGRKKASPSEEPAVGGSETPRKTRGRATKNEA